MLLTRAPVAGGSASTPPLPLDLHVLSLSLAFILSQDQTLRCYYSFELLFFALCLSDVSVTDCHMAWPGTDAHVRCIYCLYLFQILSGSLSFPFFLFSCTVSYRNDVNVLFAIYGLQNAPPSTPFPFCECKVNTFFHPFQIFLQTFLSSKHLNTANPLLTTKINFC